MQEGMISERSYSLLRSGAGASEKYTLLDVVSTGLSFEVGSIAALLLEPRPYNQARQRFHTGTGHILLLLATMIERTTRMVV